jgi:PPK2 family polyphosphate:nucleotide phosphotransferase
MDAYRIKPGEKVKLEDWDPKDDRYFPGGKEAAAQKLVELNEELETLQEILYAEQKHKVLVVLQGMDTSGKDGVIRHVFEGVNPQGVRVASFKAPVPVELAHDYLWRVHQQTPANGEIVIFNRSHYEDVLVVRVHALVAEPVWSQRYAQIREFENLLVSAGTTILKFYLHISYEEQRQRLQARLDDPTKRWKFRLGDLEDRKLWAEYQEAYEDALSRTSSEAAPWYIVPSDRKWYRNLVIGEVIIDALKKLELRYPEPEENLDGVVVER